MTKKLGNFYSAAVFIAQFTPSGYPVQASLIVYYQVRCAACFISGPYWSDSQVSVGVASVGLERSGLMVPYLSNPRIFLSNRRTFYAMSLYLKISANFRTGATLPTIEEQYHDLWQMASTLEKIGLPIDDWCIPAHSPADAQLNAAFNAAGTTDAVLALARAHEDKIAKELRTIAIWNGKNDVGGATLITTYNRGRIPSNLRLSEESIPAFSHYEHVVQIVRAIVEIWKPMLVKVTPWGYPERQVFKDRPPVGWMIYLPFELASNQIPEAAKLVAIGDTRKKGNAGTLVISTTDVFDVDNQEHVNNANAIETRLVDQDLLPTFREFVIRF